MKTPHHKHERSLEAELIRFIFLFGIPFVSALSLLGGLAAGLLAGD